MKNWSFVIAGIAALGVTLIRAIAGAKADLEPLMLALDGNSLKGVVLISWHSVTAIFAILSVALIVASRLSRPSQLVIGVISALAFGAVCLIFMTVTALETGSPFTYPPFVPLGLASLLSAAAAWQAFSASK